MGNAAWDVDRDRSGTSLGLMLMAIGIAVSWIPVILYIGSLLLIIGAILVILHRNGFGGSHGAFVISAFLIYILVIIVATVGTLAFTDSLIYSGGSVPTMEGALRGYIYTTLVIGVLGSVSYFLLPYGLSRGPGKKLLILALVAQVAVTISVFMVVSGDLIQAFSLAVSTHSSSPLLEVKGKLSLYGLVGAIPSLMFAAAYYMARLNVEEDWFSYTG